MKFLVIALVLLISTCLSSQLRQNNNPTLLSDIGQTFADGRSQNYKGKDVQMRDANFKYGKNCSFNSDDLTMSSSSMIAQDGFNLNLNGNLQMSNDSKIDLGSNSKINVKSATVTDSTVTWKSTNKGNIKGKWTFINSTFNGKKITRDTRTFN